MACKPGTPKQYIQPDDMENILVDYHLAKALAHRSSINYEDRDVNQVVYIEAVLKKHGVTKEDFDSSLVYYYTRADRFEGLYKRVAERLEEKALILGASEGEIGKYAQLDATGDTANIWADRSMTALMPVPPYNRWDFELEADSTYRRGDSFLFQFVSDFMYQSGLKSGILYVAVEYTDTVMAQFLRFSTSGFSQMRVKENDKQDIKRLKGYFYVENGNEAPSTTRLLFLNSVQLIRFHKEIIEDEENKADSIKPDSVGGRLLPDTLSAGDSLRHRDLPLSIDTGTATHRVDLRRNNIKER